MIWLRWHMRCRMNRIWAALSFTWLPCLLADTLPNDKLVAVVKLIPPKGGEAPEKANYLGYLATFSVLPPESGLQATTWAAPGASADGCENHYTGMPSGAIAIARRGQCSFVQKVLVAQAAGASAVAVVSDTEKLIVMDVGNMSSKATEVQIAVVGITKSLGDKLFTLMEEHVGDHPELMISPYNLRLWNPSEGILVMLGTGLIVAGAFFATADLRSGSPLAPRLRDTPSTAGKSMASSERPSPEPLLNDEVVEVDDTMAISFCVMGSLVLTVLFFLMRYLIYVIIAGFCIQGGSCIAQLCSSLLAYGMPATRRQVLRIPVVSLSIADLLGVVPAVALVIAWFVTRRNSINWLFQDIIGGAFLCMFQRTLHLPDIRIASLLLSLMFFFDIFWVFLSPFFFKKSVMMEVATGGGSGEVVPFLLRIPAIGDPLASERMLGFGDIALPGLLVSYLLRFDTISQKNRWRGYFLPSVCGYMLGLTITTMALMWSGMGQPALLYLVPCTLGTTLILGTCRRELHLLWKGPEPTEQTHQLDRLDEDET